MPLPGKLKTLLHRLALGGSEGLAPPTRRSTGRSADKPGSAPVNFTLGTNSLSAYHFAHESNHFSRRRLSVLLLLTGRAEDARACSGPRRRGQVLA